ncbi:MULTISPECIES: DUF3000 domain-containing protein [unclassified Actinomyces]|uniref:DUF3000 domain-containing protein n=2 Tax=Actinomyces TaxID=1654 RepID=UPI002016C7BB|nr:DUF3000 domain-containing protein [Actinomyces sp. 187325]MCL3778362.1 DUF3000 domain-containing protein [Actinomyces sp. AC-20-1]MCL3789950.1 DUF3000 domain-containing protein [Actinomyces sp. 187325]MCL3792171.1 DUF3000 domain-containing protein [Actinomyces sp. 186855]MCL3794334.1 DUF3000 domain-containing protein [Actinomyces sp. 217892]
MTDSRAHTPDQAGTDLPERFEEALLSLRAAARPRGLVLDEVPAPRRLAPFAAALTAETTETQAGTPLASGRFVVLHDPGGQAAWDGDFRLVVMARARVDAEVGTDPVLGAAAWSWLAEALDHQGAGHRALVGTVTRVLSETFGGLELTDACAHAEVRASWSPASPDLGPHLAAWYELLHVAAGHEPEQATALSLTGLAR